MKVTLLSFLKVSQRVSYVSEYEFIHRNKAMTNRTVKVALVLLFVLASVITLRIVSMPPQYYESKFHFAMHASELHELSDEFDKIPAAQSIALVGSSLIVEGKAGIDYADSLTDSQKERLSQLMIDIEVPRLRRTDLGNMVVIGSENKFGKTYQIHLIAYYDMAYLRPPNCTEESDGDFGVCSFPLEGNWALRYEWLPIVHSESEDGS